MTADCMLVTCDSVPDLDPDDRTLVEELAKRGISTAVGVWSDTAVDWAQFRLCVIRSTWDYHARYSTFLDWIERTASVTSLRNDAAQLRWSSDKAYLSDLSARGIPVVPTVYARESRVDDLARLSASRGWNNVVVKPARGAAAHDVLLVGRSGASFEFGQAHLDGISQRQDVLIQPYLRSVEAYGERALVFFRNRFSHAVMKKPFDTVLSVSHARSALVEATRDEIALAEAALAIVPGRPLYARVDLLRGDDGQIFVSEVELIEPGLYLQVHDEACGAFADAIETELRIS